MRQCPYTPHAKVISKAMRCPHCNQKPMGTRVGDYYNDHRIVYLIVEHQCTDERFLSAVSATQTRAVIEWWNPWVKQQRIALNAKRNAAPIATPKSFWQKLLTGWA